MLITALVPVYNEEESLEKLYPRLKSALESLKMGYEIIFVDDGSSDSTLDILKKLAAKDKSIRIFSFRKHQGKAEALTYGFQRAKGDYVVTLDADLQDNPKEIPNFLQICLANSGLLFPEKIRSLSSCITSPWNKIEL